MQPLVSTPTWSEFATLTTNSALLSTPVSSLQTLQPKELWMSTTDTGVFIEADHGSSAAWNLVFLGYHNLSTAGTIRVRAATTQGNLTAAPVHDSTALAAWQSQDLSSWPRRPFLYWVATPVTSRWLRIDLEDATNPDNVLRAGILRVSLAWQAPLHMQLGMQRGYLDLGSRQQSAIDGTIYPRRVAIVKTVQFVLGYLTEAENDALDEILRIRGAQQDVLIVEDTPPTTYLAKKIYYGLLTMSLGTRPHLSRFEQRLDITELV